MCLSRAEFLAELILQSSVLTFTPALARAQNASNPQPASPLQPSSPNTATLGCLPLKTSGWGCINISRHYFKTVGGKLLLNISCASVAVACDRASVRGRCFGSFPSEATTWTFKAGGARRMPLLCVGVKGDSTLKSNYTTITSSLIKRRATGLIQPCDPAKTPAHVGLTATQR